MVLASTSITSPIHRRDEMHARIAVRLPLQCGFTFAGADHHRLEFRMGRRHAHHGGQELRTRVLPDADAPRDDEVARRLCGRCRYAARRQRVMHGRDALNVEQRRQMALHVGRHCHRRADRCAILKPGQDGEKLEHALRIDSRKAMCDPDRIAGERTQKNRPGAEIFRTDGSRRSFQRRSMSSGRAMILFGMSRARRTRHQRSTRTTAIRRLRVRRSIGAVARVRCDSSARHLFTASDAEAATQAIPNASPAPRI